MRRTMTLLALLLFNVGCRASAVTQIQVVIQADQEVIARSARILLEARDDLNTTLASEVFAIDQASFPLRHNVRASASPNVLLTVRAVDGVGSTLITTQLRTSFTTGQTVEVQIRLYDQCLGIDCPDGFTCDVTADTARCEPLLPSTLDGGVVDGTMSDGSLGDVASEPGMDGATNPFEAACYERTALPSFLPPTLMIALDRSSSMDSDNRWRRAVEGIQNALAETNSPINVGLLLFPGSDPCVAHVAGQVLPAPVNLNRAQIMTVLANNDPLGGATPIVDAVTRSWQTLTAFQGRRAVSLITDGSESCVDETAQAAAFAEAAQRSEAGILTGVFGLDASNSFLSRLALEGGTRQSATCSAQCGTDEQSCTDDSDRPNGQLCDQATPFPVPFPLPGTCSCSGDAQCASQQTCTPFMNRGFSICTSAAECCHQRIDNTGPQLRAALLQLIERLSSECVFQIPDPGSVILDNINLGVTLPGEARRVGSIFGFPAERCMVG